MNQENTDPKLDPATRRRLRQAFLLRAGFLGLVWGACALLADPASAGVFSALLIVLAWGLPVAAPLLLWLDWRWLHSHPDEVNRFGLRSRG